MSVVAASPPGRSRIAAFGLLALITVVPAAWIAWSLNAASAAAETISSQSILLAEIRERLATLRAGPQGTAAGGAGMHLPGETAAIAGAALQALVAEAIQSTGGRVVETELARTEPTEEDPGRVDLRASFDAEIVTLQEILYKLESGAPVLLLQALSIQSPAVAETGGGTSPPLRVTVSVSGFWEAAEPAS